MLLISAMVGCRKNSRQQSKAVKEKTKQISKRILNWKRKETYVYKNVSKS